MIQPMYGLLYNLWDFLSHSARPQPSFFSKSEMGQCASHLSFDATRPVVLQIGHRFFIINHCLMQAVWKSCPQSSRPTSSSSTYSSCQTSRENFVRTDAD